MSGISDDGKGWIASLTSRKAPLINYGCNGLKIHLFLPAIMAVYRMYCLLFITILLVFDGSKATGELINGGLVN